MSTYLVPNPDAWKAISLDLEVFNEVLEKLRERDDVIIHEFHGESGSFIELYTEIPPKKFKKLLSSLGLEDLAELVELCVMSGLNGQSGPISMWLYIGY